MHMIMFKFLLKSLYIYIYIYMCDVRLADLRLDGNCGRIHVRSAAGGGGALAVFLFVSSRDERKACFRLVVLRGKCVVAESR